MGIAGTKSSVAYKSAKGKANIDAKLAKSSGSSNNSSGGSSPSAVPQMSLDQIKEQALGIQDSLNQMAKAQGNIAGKPAVPAMPEGQPMQPNQPNAQEQEQTQQQVKGTGLQYNPAVNPSVVDLLNSAGQPSDMGSRTQLAGQLGISDYKGTAAQNQELAKKFTDMYNAKKGGAAPASQADFMQQMQTYNEENQQPQPFDEIQSAFWGTYNQMNPIEKYLFDGMSELMSPTRTKDTLREIYEEELNAQGIPGLNTELADINRIIDGTEDDIRAEVQATGGMATESQVAALASARNKTLIRRAQYLSDLIDSKNEYVDRIVALTQADREQVDKDIDRKLGLSKMMFEMSDRMTTRARENYQSVVKDVGYDGLVSNMTSQRELDTAASALGMSPNTLMRLSTMQTTAQKQQELQMMEFELSVDKFNEDKRQFGLSYALQAQKASEEKAAKNALSPYQMRNSQLAISEIDSLLPRVGALTVGKGAAIGKIPFIGAGTPARDFSADVDELLSSIFKNELNAMREASKTGGAVGNVSDKEGSRLSNSIGALEDLTQSPANYTKNLLEAKDAINSWNAQLLAIQKGFDYEAAKSSGWSSEEIFNYLNGN